jgi:hypothetical protein
MNRDLDAIVHYVVPGGMMRRALGIEDCDGGAIGLGEFIASADESPSHAGESRRQADPVQRTDDAGTNPPGA